MKNEEYWKICDFNSNVNDRRKLNIGDIFENKARCLLCNDVLHSKSRNDRITCKCGNLTIDGGSWEIIREVKEENSFENLFVYYKNIEL